jgi:hypothetical protein
MRNTVLETNLEGHVVVAAHMLLLDFVIEVLLPDPVRLARHGRVGCFWRLVGSARFSVTKKVQGFRKYGIIC